MGVRGMNRHTQRERPGFGAREDGGVLVEFGLVLPIMLLFFAITVEAARMLWSYQTAISGVRDASRYLARTAPVDICVTGGSLAGYASTLKDIVEKDLSDDSVMPGKVTVNSVTPTHTCVAGTYRVSPAPVATVTANMTIEFPLSGIMGMFGSGLPTLTTNVTDQAKIYGQ